MRLPLCGAAGQTNCSLHDERFLMRYFRLGGNPLISGKGKIKRTIGRQSLSSGVASVPNSISGIESAEYSDSEAVTAMPGPATEAMLLKLRSSSAGKLPPPLGNPLAACNGSCKPTKANPTRKLLQESESM